MVLCVKTFMHVCITICVCFICVHSELVTFQGPYKEPLDYPFLKKDEKSKWIDPRGFTVTGLKQVVVGNGCLDDLLSRQSL